MKSIPVLLLSVLLLFFSFIFISPTYAASHTIIDDAQLLKAEEKDALEKLADEYSRHHEIQYIIISTNDTHGKDIVQYVEDYYDEKAPGFDKKHGNTAILMVDLFSRDVYLAGFKKAETLLDDNRLNRIRNKITPDLSEGNYYVAFSKFIKTADRYMNYPPGVNPENIIFKWWFQLLVSLSLGALVVALMATQIGRKVTVHGGTYLNAKDTRILDRYDKYVNQTVTRIKKPKSNSNGGGGGGISSGGHSHSGSRGKF